MEYEVAGPVDERRGFMSLTKTPSPSSRGFDGQADSPSPFAPSELRSDRLVQGEGRSSDSLINEWLRNLRPYFREPGADFQRCSTVNSCPNTILTNRRNDHAGNTND